MPSLRQSLPIIAVACALGHLVACNSEDDANEGYTQVSADHDTVTVALLPGDGGDITPGGEVSLDILSVSEDPDAPVGLLTISHTYVPATWGAYESPIDERIRVLVEMSEAALGTVDRVDLTVDVGDGTSISSLELEQDALNPTHFYVFLKPSCGVESRDADGVCQLDPLSACAAGVGASLFEVDGRCDGFQVRLWALTDTSDDEATATPDEALGSMEAPVRAPSLGEAAPWRALAVDPSEQGS